MKGGVLKIVLRYIIGGILVLALLFVGFVLAVNQEVFGHLYSKQELRAFKNQTASQIVSNNGILLGKFFVKNRTHVTYTDLPQHLVDALVATEDARYFEHDGVDSRSLIRVLFKTIIWGDASSGGGSTITQQLLKNMYGRSSFGPLTMLVNKTKEGILAYRLEAIYTKEEILTLYLNTIPFGEDLYGIESAARRYFNKSVGELNLQESAVLIGLLKANTYYNPRLHPDHSLQRRNVVMKQMVKYNYIAQSAYDSLKLLPLELDYANLASEGPANYFLVRVKKELEKVLQNIAVTTGKTWNYQTDGLRVETTLDYALQTKAYTAFSTHLRVMQKHLRRQYEGGKSAKNLEKYTKRKLARVNRTEEANFKNAYEIFDFENTYVDSISLADSVKLAMTTLHAGVLGLSPQTGEILTYIGGIDYRTQPFDQIMAERQLASTFKPILYAAAIEKGISPCEYLDNTAKTYVDFDDWRPSNYDLSEGGKYSMQGALTKSKNIPSVNLLFQVGFDEVDYLWRKMGFAFYLNYTPSLALGTGEASIYELAIAYAVFANGGKKVDPFTIKRIIAPDGSVIYSHPSSAKAEKVLESNTSELMNAMLQNVIAKGTGVAMRKKYNVTMPLAGKTGTSQHYVDAWFAGYNPNIVLVTRVGTSSNKIHFNSGYGAGSALALPIVALTLQKVEADLSLQEKYTQDFAPLTEQQKQALNCEDFIEDTKVDKLLKLFKKDETTVDSQFKKSKSSQQKEKTKKKKGWFKRKK